MASCRAMTCDRAEDRAGGRQARAQRAIDRLDRDRRARAQRAIDRLARDHLGRDPSARDPPAGGTMSRGNPVTRLAPARRAATDPAPRLVRGSVSAPTRAIWGLGSHIRRSMPHPARAPADRAPLRDRAMGPLPAVGRTYATSGFPGSLATGPRRDPDARVRVESSRRTRGTVSPGPRRNPVGRRRDEDNPWEPAAIDRGRHGPIGTSPRTRRRARRRGREMPARWPSSRSDPTRSWWPAAARSRRRSPPGARRYGCS